MPVCYQECGICPCDSWSQLTWALLLWGSGARSQKRVRVDKEGGAGSSAFFLQSVFKCPFFGLVIPVFGNFFKIGFDPPSK